MVADVSLVWLNIDDRMIHASKVQVRDWIKELNLPGATMERTGTVVAFTEACKETKTSYVDEVGDSHSVWAFEAKRRKEWITFEIVADGRALAQLKYFTPRRTQFGLVKDSHRIMPTIKPGMLPSDTAAAQDWIAKALALFEETQGTAPRSAVRRIVRETMSRGAIPVYRRSGVWFAYGDGLEHCRAAGTFAQRAAHEVDFWIIPVAEHADPTLFALSAEEHLMIEVRLLEEDLDAWAGKHNQRTPRKEMLGRWRATIDRVAAEAAMHEERLGIALAQLHPALATAVQLIDALDPKASLPGVTVR